MSNRNIEEHVLPRPVEQLPDYAHGKARQALAEKIVQAFDLTEASAEAIANAVVDPTEVRKLIGEPTDPGAEKIPVPGGTLLGIRTTVWARRVVPDPRNPRALPQYRHPFAEDPGAGNEASRFRPLSDPRAPRAEAPCAAELVVDVENREHLTWAASRAAKYVLHENDWTSSIKTQGIMEAVWLVATTFSHEDGSPTATALVTAEGSSRLTSTHSILAVQSADIPYEDETRIRKRIRELNEKFIKEPTFDVQVALRCERLPALVIVGFRPHVGGGTTFPTALRSLVALRHVDYPRPWGEGPENEALANEVLDELHRRGVITERQKAYYAGALTKTEAKAAHLPDDPTLRAAQIVRLFSRADKDAHNAIRTAFTSQATRKNITQKRRDELATALILRAIVDEPAKVDRARRYIREAFSAAVHKADWDATNRTTDQLVDMAIREVEGWLANGNMAEDPGSSTLELAVRAAYPLIVTGRLSADRGSAGNDQPDRRKPSEVLETMRQSVQGIRQLGRAITDFQHGVAIRAVDASGEVRTRDDGSGPALVHDVYLRSEYPPPGQVKSSGNGGATPADRFNHALAAFGGALEGLHCAFATLSSVAGDDGNPLVDGTGVETRLVEPWRSTLKQMEDELGFWGRTFSRSIKVRIPTPRDIAAEDDSRNLPGDDDEEANDQGDGGYEDYRNADDKLKTIRTSEAVL